LIFRPREREKDGDGERAMRMDESLGPWTWDLGGRGDVQQASEHGQGRLIKNKVTDYFCELVGRQNGVVVVTKRDIAFNVNHGCTAVLDRTMLYVLGVLTVYGKMSEKEVAREGDADPGQ
jgi:hypothetical protein